jgi:hypothetical protein
MGKIDDDFEVYCLTWTPKYERIFKIVYTNKPTWPGDSKNGLRIAVALKLSELLAPKVKKWLKMIMHTSNIA